MKIKTYKKSVTISEDKAVDASASGYVFNKDFADVLCQFRNEKTIETFNRPTANFVELMEWAKVYFATTLTDPQKIVNNRIIVDEEFITFCKTKGVTITCLMNDSIITWKNSVNNQVFEKFFGQGVFEIKTKKLTFIHCALFHKGNSFEDDVSFFCLVGKNDIEKFIEFRNSFDDYLSEKDRKTLQINVVNGDPIPYDRTHKWEDLFFPDEIKTDIKNSVENFLNSEKFYKENKLPWKRGFLLFGEPGCGKTSLIRTLISEYDFKPCTITPAAQDDDIREAFAYAQKQSPALLYFEDLDSLLETSIDLSSFLNLMDGISSPNGLLVIATANEIKKLKPSVKDRPSRFDRKWLIPLPDKTQTSKYLSKFFGKNISAKSLKEITETSISENLSYAYLKELYISSMFNALSKNRKVPNQSDIDKAFADLLREKQSVTKNGSFELSKYFDKES